jgi:hypothetical protein
MKFLVKSIGRKIAGPIIRRIAQSVSQSISRQMEDMLILQGRALALQNANRAPLSRLEDAEFKVFSQYGEDGILQHLIRETEIEQDEQIFVEFGVENYLESNTRFLLQSDYWRGMIIDGNKENMEFVRQNDLYWRNDLTAVAAWINRDNINDLIGSAGFKDNIGILSIDIDGNDYWVWEKINIINPVIVVVEWNGIFGARHAVTIPYESEFHRFDAHYSGLYYGASMRAFEILACRKGYSMVGTTRIGNNLFFVRNDRLGKLQPRTTDEVYVVPRFRDSRNAEGKLNFLSGSLRYDEIKGLPVVDLIHNNITTLHDLDKM